MGQRRRFVFSPSQKVILWIGGLFCIWQVIQTPAVFDAILNFYAAGAVPGTGIVLAPDTVLRFLLAFFVSCALVVCYREFGRRPRRKQTTAPMAGSLYVPPVVPPALSRRTVAVRMPARVMREIMVARATGMRWGLVVWERLQQLWVFVRPKLVTLGRSSGRIAGKMGNAIVAAIIWILAVESALAIWTWQFLEPHIRQFDRWLERKVNANPYGARLVAIVSAAARMASAARQRAAARSAKRADILPE